MMRRYTAVSAGLLSIYDFILSLFYDCVLGHNGYLCNGVAMPAGFRWRNPWIGRRGRFYVYIHSRPDGTPFYVGKGSMYRAFRVKHSRNECHRAVVSECGPDNVRVSLIECETDEEARETEKRLIAEYRQSYALANLSTGGQGAAGYKHTPEARQNMSASRRGRTLSLEHRAAIGAGGLGRKQTEETRQKMSAAWTPERRLALAAATAGNNHPMMRADARAKVSAAKKGKPRPDQTIRRTGQVAVHNDHQSRFVSSDLAAALLLEGWRPGLGRRRAIPSLSKKAA